MNKRRNNTRMITMVIDFLHIGICIAIIILAVLVFLKPVQHAYCFPIVFLLASVLNFSSAYGRVNRIVGIRRWSPGVVTTLALGVFFLIITIVSALTVFR
ncbi:MAG: DUF6637 family protein [Lachnospiraceae bacterium]